MFELNVKLNVLLSLKIYNVHESECEVLCGREEKIKYTHVWEI